MNKYPPESCKNCQINFIKRSSCAIEFISQVAGKKLMKCILASLLRVVQVTSTLITNRRGYTGVPFIATLFLSELY